MGRDRFRQGCEILVDWQFRLICRSSMIYEPSTLPGSSNRTDPKCLTVSTEK
jgi:hypothetical protein